MAFRQTLVLGALAFLTFLSGRQVFTTMKEPSFRSLDLSSTNVSLASAHDVLTHPSNMFSLILCTLLIGSLFKTLHLVSYSQHSRLDRMVLALSGMISTAFFLQRLWDASEAGQVSMKLFTQYFLAGGLCAFITHAACTPIDVIKTRIQTSQGRYNGMGDALMKIISEEGASTLLKGLGATSSGYFLHGAFKFSLYELFKVLLSSSPESAMKPSMVIAALSGFLAECIACLLLCPMEAIRIRSVADETFPSGVINGLSLLVKTEGIQGLYKGLPAMVLKQVPYTVGQFVSFEFSIGLVKQVFNSIPGFEHATLSAIWTSAIAGLIAGVTAAIISHPGDTILSKVNQEQGEGSAWTQINHVVKNAGFAGLFVGLGPRLIQVSCMIGGQFLIYDSIKLWCGIRTAAALPAVKAAIGSTDPISLLHASERHLVSAANTLKHVR